LLAAQRGELYHLASRRLVETSGASWVTAEPKSPLGGGALLLPPMPSILRVPLKRLVAPILVALVGAAIIAVYVNAAITEEVGTGKARPALMFWLGMDGPHLFNLFGLSLDQCKTVANWWRTIQVSYIGELAIILAVIVVWIDVRHVKAILPGIVFEGDPLLTDRDTGILRLTEDRNGVLQGGFNLVFPR
jgi:hypothetical protein